MSRTLARIALSLILAASVALPAAAAGEVMQDILVNDGDTLRDIAQTYLTSPSRWTEILKHNELPLASDSIGLPAMHLLIPQGLVKPELRAARLLTMANDVRARKKSQADWSPASLNMELFNDDSLRTLERARARIRFPSGQLLQLDENSLIVLKSEQVTLMSGGIRASKTRVLASETLVTPFIKQRTPAPDFKTKLRADKTTLVEVYSGIIDVTAQGKTVTLTGGFGTEIKLHQPPSLPRRLPPDPGISAGTPPPPAGTLASPVAAAGSPEAAAAPGAHSPANTAVSMPAAPPPPVIAPIPGVKHFRVQVATDGEFEQMLVNEVHPIGRRSQIEQIKSELSPGIYYYRMAYIDGTGFEGPFSIPVRFSAGKAAADTVSKAGGETAKPETIKIKAPRDAATSLELFWDKTWTYARIFLGILTLGILGLTIAMFIKLTR